MLVLGEDEHVVERPEALADGVQVDMGHRLAAGPESHGPDLVPGVHHRLGDADLAVEFQGARLHGQGPRGRARLCGLVDHPHRDAQLRQPQGQDQARGAGAGDQDFRLEHVSCPFPWIGVPADPKLVRRRPGA